MAHCGQLSSRAARGCNRSLDVADHKLVADTGPLFIGQAFEEPATFLAQFQRGFLRTGDIRKRGMSLGGHLETIFRAWIKRFPRRSEILGAYSNDGMFKHNGLIV